MMMKDLNACSPAFVVALLIACTSDDGSTEPFPDDSAPRAVAAGDTLTRMANTSAPNNAIGYLSNGCTAALIDDDHILTAARCLVDDRTGRWHDWSTPGFFYYPAFIPVGSLFNSSVANRRAIVGATVGTRVATDTEARNADWAIARLASPLPSATYAPLPIATDADGGDAMRFISYSRYLPFLVGFDSTPINARPPGDTHGLVSQIACVIMMGGCNCSGAPTPPSWWNFAMIDNSCTTATVTSDDRMTTNCSVKGEATGAPFLRTSAGSHVITGIHGGSDGSPQLCDNVGPLAPGVAPVTGGPSAGRFVDAPWNAIDVAITSVPGSPRRTTVVVADADRNRVTTRRRNRLSNNPYEPDGPFRRWDPPSDPIPFGTMTAIASALPDPVGDVPPIASFMVAVTNAGGMYVSNGSDDPADPWTNWEPFGIPVGTAAADAAALGGHTVASTFTGKTVVIFDDLDDPTESQPMVNARWAGVTPAGDEWTNWSAWRMLTDYPPPWTSTPRRVTGAVPPGQNVDLVFVADATGAAWLVVPGDFPPNSGSDYVEFSDPGELGQPAIRDFAAGFFSQPAGTPALAFVVAVDFDARLWLRQELLPGAWAEWAPWTVGSAAQGCPAGGSCMYQPRTTPDGAGVCASEGGPQICQQLVPNLDDLASAPHLPDSLRSLSASHWAEAGTDVPVVFATDAHGGIYYTTYEGDPETCHNPDVCTDDPATVGTEDACECDVDPHWQPWRTFHHVTGYRSDLTE